MNFVFAGTSGVGKSFLEQVLKNDYGFIPLPKYTSRELREEEKNLSDIVSINREDFQQREDFFYQLKYMGNLYAWSKNDIPADNRISTMSVTLKDLERLMEDNKNLFIPIMLHIQRDNLNLIEKRITKRDNDSKSKQRLELAQKEIEEFNKYSKTVKENNGEIFVIKNDSTIYKEVIPWILEKASIKN